MNIEDYVGRSESDDGIGVRRAVVEELLGHTLCEFRCVGLLAADLVERYQARHVSGAGVVQDAPDDLLHLLFPFFVDFRGLVGGDRILRRLAIFLRLGGEWAVLRLALLHVLVSLQLLFDVPWYGDVQGSSVVIPLEGYTAVEAPLPIDCAFVMLLQNMNQMIRMFLSNVLHTEVVYHQGELHRPGDVLP